MFCGCANRFGARARTRRPVRCASGSPARCPCPTARAVEFAIRLGLALGAKIADVTRFDRKQYFYPDLPKGYQISQFDRPVTFDGKLAPRDHRAARRRSASSARTSRRTPARACTKKAAGARSST